MIFSYLDPVCAFKFGMDVSGVKYEYNDKQRDGSKLEDGRKKITQRKKTQGRMKQAEAHRRK